MADGYGCHGNGQSPVDDVRGTETPALQGKHPPFLDLPRSSVPDLFCISVLRFDPRGVTWGGVGGLDAGADVTTAAHPTDPK